MLWVLKQLTPKTGYAFKLLTLTMRSSKDLSVCYRDLLVAFRRLRSRRLWKDHVDGGVYVVEVTHGTPGWHVHLHAIISARFVPQRLLSKQWNACSGSPVLDIRKITLRYGIQYVTKYITSSELPTELRIQASAVMTGARMWSPIGACHDLNATYKPPPFVCCQCQNSTWIVPEFQRNGHSVECVNDP